MVWQISLSNEVGKLFPVSKKPHRRVLQGNVLN